MSKIELTHTVINFPDVSANASAGDKLRGYISSLVNNESEHLFHNHNTDGKLIYRYPRIQYKVIKNVPYIVGIMEGSDQLVKLFLNIKELNIDGNIIPVNSKTISRNIVTASVNQGLFKYRFETMWMGLNQKNYKEYIGLYIEHKQTFLEKCLTNNILSFYKAVGLFVTEKILVTGSFKPHNTNFKDNKMIVFSGSFTTNVQLPDYIGLGKSVSRGYGTIKRIND